MLTDLSTQFAPVAPLWLIGLLAAAILGGIAVGTAGMLHRAVAPRWALALAALRLGAWGIFLAILLQPAVSWTGDAEPRAELVVLVDTSASMERPGAGGTRIEEVRGKLTRGDFAEALRERFRPHWFAFDRTAVRIEPTELMQRPAAGPETRLADSVHAACALLRAEGRPARHVLLASDGNDHGAADVAELARRLGVKVDVLAPTPHAAGAAPAVTIADVQAARRVLLGSETHFRVTVQADPPPAADQKLALRLTEDGKELQTLAVAVKAGQAEQVLMLAHRPTATGTKTYAFSLQPPAGPAKQVAVQVVDRKYEILVLEDAWRWEYKFLHRIFEDDPSFRFTALLPRGGRSYVQFASPDRRVNLVGFPQTAADLEPFDLFFLGDVDPTRWPRELPAALARLVAEDGKSLVVLAGPRLGALADLPELHALLPVEVDRTSGTPVAGVIDVRPAVGAAGSPWFFQLGSAAELPPVDHVYPVRRKRPAATVLLEATKHRNDYGPLIVMAEHTVGRGRVLFVGTDTLWKWQTLATRDGPTPYTTFWQQALRALTPERSQLGPVQLWLIPARSRSEAGRPLDLATEVQSTKPLSAVKVQGVLTGPGDERRPIALAVDPANPARFQTTVTPPTPGTYHVRATLFAQGRAVAEASATVQVEAPRGEAQDAGIDAANLRRIAAATGGRWVDVARPETWPAPDDATAAAMPRVRTLDLWGSFALLLLLLGVLGTDWALRVMKGFV